MRSLLSVSGRQYLILTSLTLCALLWLLYLTCLKEYWGFWQSPHDYHFLTKEYPQWLRDYVRRFHLPVLVLSMGTYAVWLGLSVLRLKKQPTLLFGIVALSLLVGLTLGVLCANNLIMFLDHGDLHGSTHLQWQD